MIRREIQSIVRMLRSLPWAFFWQLCAVGVFANFFFLSEYFLSIDDDYASVREFPSIWIGQGRWGAFLVELFLAPQPVLPVVTYLVFILASALFLVVLTSAHGFRGDLKLLFAGILFFSAPSLWLLLIFKANVWPVSFGLVFLSLHLLVSAPVADSSWGRGRLLSLAASSVFVGLAISMYQSFLMLAVAIAAGMGLSKLREGLPLSLRLLAFQSSSIGIGLSFYFIIDQVLKHSFGISPTYISGYIRPANVLDDPLFFVFANAMQAFRSLATHETLFGQSLSAPIFLILAGVLLLLLRARERVISVIVLLAVVLGSTVALNFVGSFLPLRSMLVIPYIFWLFAAILIQDAQRSFRILGILLSTVVSFQFLSLTAQYSANAILRSELDKEIAMVIHQEASKCAGTVQAQVPHVVDFRGNLSFSSPFVGSPQGSDTGSFFGWYGEKSRAITYMGVSGFSSITLAGEELSSNLESDFQAMDNWPSADSVRCVDGVLLIRFSDY